MMEKQVLPRTAARPRIEPVLMAKISATANNLDHMGRPSNRSMRSTTREALRAQLCPNGDHHSAICMMRRRRQRGTSTGAMMLPGPLPYLSNLRLSSLLVARTWPSISRAIPSNRDRDRDLLLTLTCVLQLPHKLPHVQPKVRSPRLRHLRHLARFSSRSGFLSQSAAQRKKRSRLFGSIRQ